MFKEVLHQTYKLGVAADTSGYGNHGTPIGVSFLGAGRQPDTGAAQYISPSARIRVDANQWDQPVAVQIDAWVKVMTPATPRRLNIVEADRSFAFFIHPDHSLWGTFVGPPAPGATPIWHGANTNDNHIAGGPGAVPIAQWTKLTYLHDGFGTLRLYIDGSLAAQNNIWAAVPPVQPNGIEIGHWVGDDRYTFSGEIDDVRIAVYDPNAIVEEFYCRLDEKTAACWDHAIASMGGMLDNPDFKRKMLAVFLCVQETLHDLVRAIVRSGPGTKHELADLRKKWLELWCKGAAPDPDVVDLMEKFVSLFERIMGHRAWCAWLDRLLHCVQQVPINEQTRQLFENLAKCDPWYAALLKAGEKRGLHKRCEERQQWFAPSKKG